MNIRSILYISLFVLLSFLGGCQNEEQMVSLGLRDLYIVPRMQKLHLAPEFTGQGYLWTEVLPDGRDSLVSTGKDYIFLKKDPGTYKMRFEIIDPVHYMNEKITVIVAYEETEYKTGIDKVYEYKPAPGQFVNVLPLYEPGDKIGRAHV